MSTSFEEAYRFLSPRFFTPTTWSLEPTRALLAELGHPEREYATVHVGGTNGKGSVCALAAAALREAGHSVGLYSSPHLVDVRERMLVDGRPIGRDAFAAWTERLRPAIERVRASFFEATTAMALADFAARGVDIAVIEVGLGGRLDSTNVLEPLASAVTSIAREHTEYLGEALEGIAREKAGIAKRDTPFVVGERSPDVARVLEAEARRRGAHPVVVLPPEEEFRGPLALEGPHQQRNAVVALSLLAALPAAWRPTDDAVARGFARARLPGRFDRRGRWIFDVAHNPAGIAVLVQALGSVQLTRPVHALVGILRDKGWREMLSELAPVVDGMWLTTPPTAPAERLWDLEEVRQAMEGDGGRWKAMEIQPDFDRALEEVQHGAGTILVTGSFHTVGDALARLPGFAPLG